MSEVFSIVKTIGGMEESFQYDENFLWGDGEGWMGESAIMGDGLTLYKEWYSIQTAQEMRQLREWAGSGDGR